MFELVRGMLLSNMETATSCELNTRTLEIRKTITGVRRLRFQIQRESARLFKNEEPSYHAVKVIVLRYPPYVPPIF